MSNDNACGRSPTGYHEVDCGAAWCKHCGRDVAVPRPTKMLLERAGLPDRNGLCYTADSLRIAVEATRPRLPMPFLDRDGRRLGETVALEQDEQGNVVGDVRYDAAGGFDATEALVSGAGTVCHGQGGGGGGPDLPKPDHVR